jgi:hypothetical protein
VLILAPSRARKILGILSHTGGADVRWRLREAGAPDRAVDISYPGSVPRAPIRGLVLGLKPKGRLPPAMDASRCRPVVDAAGKGGGQPTGAAGRRAPHPLPFARRSPPRPPVARGRRRETSRNPRGAIPRGARRWQRWPDGVRARAYCGRRSLTSSSRVG